MVWFLSLSRAPAQHGAVGTLQALLLDEPGDPELLQGRDEGEGRYESSLVIELDQHRLADGGHHRAGGVAVVALPGLPAGHLVKQVLHQDRNLPLDAGRGLAAGNARDGPDREDLRKARSEEHTSELQS